MSTTRLSSTENADVNDDMGDEQEDLLIADRRQAQPRQPSPGRMTPMRTPALPDCPVCPLGPPEKRSVPDSPQLTGENRALVDFQMKPLDREWALLVTGPGRSGH